MTGWIVLAVVAVAIYALAHCLLVTVGVLLMLLAVHRFVFTFGAGPRTWGYNSRGTAMFTGFLLALGIVVTGVWQWLGGRTVVAILVAGGLGWAFLAGMRKRP